ncbi:MAG: fatty acyl-AMP ligase, partial [Acidobacteriota bacterium]
MHGLSESSSASLVDLLHQHAEEQGGERAYTFLTADDSAPRHLSWSELEAAAGTVAAALTERGLAGERAILLYPPGLDFIAAFLGCLWAGVIAVPAYAPTSRRTLPRFVSIARDAGPRVALTTEEMLPRLETLSARAPELAALPRLATDNLPLGEGPQSTATRAEQPAFLQYTSGSTSAPKGVVVRHGNLMHQAEMMRRAFELSRDAVIVGWLPLFHDMGLIGNVLQPLYLGARCVLMAPMAFLRQPRRWLEAISHYRATVSGGPNFAYELCADRIAEADRAALDLSRWRVAFNGAEPVRPATLERFADAFAPSGFRREAFYPCYGLAEGTLFVTGGTVDQVPRLGAFQAEALAAHRVARAWGGTATRTLASNGRPWMGQGVVIADPETRRRCAPSDVGEIWVAGDSVAQGYWKRPEASEETFRAR